MVRVNCVFGWFWLKVPWYWLSVDACEQGQNKYFIGKMKMGLCLQFTVRDYFKLSICNRA